MILEIATLQIKAEQAASFEKDFITASAIISSMPGYLDHELQRCIEKPGEYALLVQWQTVDDHMVGFRQSPQFQEWRKLLQPYFVTAPTVQHYETAYSSTH